MQDFNDYVKNEKSTSNTQNQTNQNLMSMVMGLAQKFDGKNTSELIKAIYEEAKKGKRNGTLSNADIDNFSTMLCPLLDEKQRKLLRKITEELKRI